jgi:hypothetical protein
MTYYGQDATTKNGATCQSWKTQTDYNENEFPNEGILGAVNYCRTVASSQPWCYTDISKDQWAYCNVDQCLGCSYIPYVQYAQYQLSKIKLNNIENTIQSGNVQYTCNYGTLVGSNIISCVNGEWAPAAPRCDGIIIKIL